MANSTRAGALWAALAVVSTATASAAGPVGGRWMGQEKHDKVGAKGTIGPNGVQDVRIALSGLPRLEITSVTVKGHGADQWLFPIAPNLSQFAAVLDRKPGAPSADVYFEPLRKETGREFYVKLTFNGGAETETYLKGGTADPNLRMPSAAVVPKWGTQMEFDLAGLGPGVGPDGFQDAQIAVSNLSKGDRVAGMLLEGPGGARWAFGPNPEGHHNAEFAASPKDPTRGTLLFQPTSETDGKTFTLTVQYEGGKSDSVSLTGGKAAPQKRMAAVEKPKLAEVTVKAEWLGQGAGSTNPGEVRVVLKDLPAGKTLVGAVLSDGVRSAWVWLKGQSAKVDVEPDVRPLELRRVGDGLELSFTPYRELEGQTLFLRLVDNAGGESLATFKGGASELSRTAPIPERSQFTARPGDDLNALAARHGNVRLAAGTHVMTRPLVLARPISLVGDEGAVIEFRQGGAEPPWTAAIKVHAGGTTLKGFAVRFAGPVRWRADVSWGPAVIGTTDNLDDRKSGPLANLAFEGLTLTGPVASKTEGWEEAPKLMRLLNATNGRIVGNTLAGGPVEFFGGPWTVEKNTFTGTPANTYCHVAFAAHKPHDLIFRNNRAKSAPGSGKTWRFLLLTNRGANNRVEDNAVEGIGPRDDDAIPPMNSPEIFLTESYHVRFEGRPSAISEDGRVVKVGYLRGEPPVTGDVVSVLAGEQPGEWRRIAQRIDEKTYLLDGSLPKGTEVISIAPGFVNDVYNGNSVDAKGGRAAAGFVLAGNHYGTRVTGNRVVGAGDAFQIMAYPSESPGIWGWTHAPYFGGLFARNVIEDSERGAQIGVLHNGNDKSSGGRAFMTVELKENVVTWSEAFLNRAPDLDAKGKAFLPGINLGWERPGKPDPAELVVKTEDDRLVSPRGGSTPALKVVAATVNGKVVKGASLPLPSTAVGTTSARR